MVKVAVLADIHGNLPALEAVIADIEAQSVDEVLVGGDLVGRGPQGRAVAHRIRTLGWPCIRGNHEDYILSFWRKEVPPEWLETNEWAASRWMASDIDDSDTVAYLDTLPLTITSQIAPELRLVHGTPDSYSKGIGPWTSEDKQRSYLDAIDEPVLLCAHTHRPFLSRLDGQMIVNVGSVGLPFNGDWRAQYVLLSYHQGRWEVEFRQVAYDRDLFLRHYDESGFLSEGDITAALLRIEVLKALPHLVPFKRWTVACERPFEHSELNDFLHFYDPTLSSRVLIQRLKDLQAES